MSHAPLARLVRIGLALCFALAAAGSPATPPAAAAPAGPPATYYVDRDDDTTVIGCDSDTSNNNCTLRGAIQNANANPGSVVQLQWNHVYTLTDVVKQQLIITNSMTIQPGGPCGQIVCATVIKAAPGWIFGLFTVGLTATAVISGVILTEAVNNNGGAIHNLGALTLYNSLILSNTVGGYGGGILNDGGNLTLHNTYVTRNRAQTFGGGIANLSGAVTLYDSSVISNTSYGVTPGQGSAGGIGSVYAYSSTVQPVLVLNHSYILTNTAVITNGYGGGIYNDGLATIISSTISGNVGRYGGGLDNNYPSTAQMTITASLIMSNTSGEGGSAIRNDGLIWIYASTITGNPSLAASGGLMNSNELTIVDSTVTYNSGNSGGGIRTGTSGAKVWIDHTDILSNTASYGGGLEGFGSFTLTNGSRVNNNFAYQGGGVQLNSTGHLWAEPGTQINGNIATGFCTGCARGGGIDNAGHMTLTGVEVLGNQSDNGAGGGLYNTASGHITVTDTLIGQNSALFGGGGLANFGAATLTASALYSNTTPQQGGGISNTGTLNLLNVTVAGNQAGYGGGVWNEGVVSQAFTTLAFNTALTGTGGLQTTGPYTTGSSLVARNLGPGTDCAGTLTSVGYNLIGNTTGCTVTGGPSDQLDLDALLLPLSFVSGTWVVDLQVDSPALDAADPAACPADDQAHQSRPLGLNCDVGAFESFNTTFYLFLPLTLR